MSSSYEYDAVDIHRGMILNGLKAILVAHLGRNHIANQDSYQCGYQDGVEHTILSVAQLAGVADELKSLIDHSPQMRLAEVKDKRLEDQGEG